ncbi:hypothetical protein PVAG01_08722 [Phlyctema vagabunda]|uniref:Uncharacterized protein n=1 Tax=Phlyctema vagabunda TaxID=108571 RepID=A0ABR4PA97_9HELO
MIVTSINPLYEVCNIPGENPASCSLVFQTSTLTSCSAVVTGFFTRITVSDCEQSITFSSQTNYSVATATVVPSASAAIIAREAASLTTYVESVVSYYIAPWQSLISNDPSGITVVICTTNYVGEKCIQVQEVWVVYTEYVPVVLTSQISISQSFSSPVILLFGPSNSLTVTAGDLDFSTQIEYTSTSANATTVTSTIESQAFSSADTNSLAERASTANYTPVQSVVPYSRVTSTRTKTRTIFVTKGTTITKILDSTSTEDPTTTLVSTTTLTKTRTIRIQTA